MSMYRQLWLALILSTTLSLVGGFLASTLGARVYLEEQLRLKNNDTAAALALSLSRGGVDQIEMELSTAALFDSGYFQSIKIRDPKGGVIVERVAAPAQDSAPQWFINSLPIVAQPGVANITDGWKQLGTVVLMSQASHAYKTLWEATKELMAALFFAGLLGAYLGTLILRRLKGPLAKVIEQARGISERRFFTTPEPKVPELRQLVAAMNSSVVRLKSMFDEEAKRLEAVRQEVNYDPLTGLANRDYFMARLRAMLETEEGPGGQLFLIRVAKLTEINRRLGRESTDALLQAVGKAIEEFATNLPDALVARLNGADFALMIPGQWDALAMGDELLQKLINGSRAFLQNEPIAFIGTGAFQPQHAMGELLTQVDSAMASAEATGVNNVREAISHTDDAPSSAEQWGRQIEHALDNAMTKIALFPVVDFSGQIIHRESALRLMLTPGSPWLPAGRFLPAAERMGMTAKLDLAVVKLGLAELTNDPQLPGLAINLSGQSIHAPEFCQKLLTLLTAQPLASKRLWLEVPEYGALAHLPAFRIFCLQLSKSGCRLGIEHFGNQFSHIGKLHDLGLDYLKIDASFIRDIQKNQGNQVFLKGLTNIVHNIGMKVFAEGVISQEEVDMLATLGFDGITGPVVK
jgi:diguanylate cyclase (GGDEF)-like protein